MSLTVGSLFSGIGGFDLGLERAGFTIKWQVEIDDYCRRVLKKHWPTVPCHADIKTVDWRDIPRVDLICGGFPCQPFSCAGKRAGKTDNRYLWPEVVRCLDVLRPAWFLGENVPGIITLALDQVCTDLESLGYAVWPVCIPACAVDAPHQRQRVWIMAHTDRTGLQGYRAEYGLEESCKEVEVSGSGEHVSDAKGVHAQGLQNGSGQIESGRSRGWSTEPAVGRVAHGVPHRVDRLKVLGNAVVPQIVEALGRMILDVEQAYKNKIDSVQ